ncbi:MAG: hypothetical protein K8R53_12305 [Bacteroidales bacterium]|nr:hypothetical protein [Bacteroidales bacterium]
MIRYIIPGFTIITLFIVLLSGCKKEDDAGDIPGVYVNFVIYPNSIDYITAGGYKYINHQGYRGIIVYRIDLYNFMAYDRTCTYDPEKECAIVEVELSGITAVDSCCMSKFNLIDGSPFDGPATIPLKQYKTNFDGNQLVIYN